MNLKKGDTFRYCNETFDMIVKLITETTNNDFSILGRIISYKKKGWLNTDWPVSFSREGLEKFARKINVEPEPIPTYTNKNNDTFTNTLKKQYEIQGGRRIKIQGQWN